MKHLLYIGDAAVASGFANVTHGYLKKVDVSTGWDVRVLGLNYHGDPHTYPYDIYPCWPGGDAWGIGRLRKWFSAGYSPDLIVIQNDPWNIEQYMKVIPDNIPVVGVLTADGKNIQGAPLNSLTGTVWWTKFGRDEARKGGYVGKADVIPLGVDLDVFKPMDRKYVRTERMNFPEGLEDAFIVGNINRNQPRKRLDLTVQYFAEWVKEFNVQDALLFLHICPTGDSGIDLYQLAHYYGIEKRLILAEPHDIGKGLNIDSLVVTYNAFDLQMTTSKGEGWGLTTMEGMACATPQIVPDWSALGDWACEAAYMVPCDSIHVTPNNINVIGGIPNKEAMIIGMNQLYDSRELRDSYINAGLQLVQRLAYRWDNISEQFLNVINKYKDLKDGTEESLSGVVGRRRDGEEVESVSELVSKTSR